MEFMIRKNQVQCQSKRNCMAENAIEISGLKKTYDKKGVKALKGVSLNVKEGDFFALLGANGAGKTTMIGIMTGVVNKSEGEVRIFDTNIDEDHSAAKRMIGVVPQEFNFNIFEKVQDIVVQQAGYFGIPRKKAMDDSEEILKRLSLWDKKDTKAIQLSGGMKRRLMIARALIHHPKLLILDEPTAGVDVELRHGMWDYLKELNRQGTTILLTTHYIEEAEALCKNVAIIKEGEIIKCEPIKELLRSMERHTYVVEVNEVKSGMSLGHFSFEKIDDNTLEVTLERGQTVNDLVKAFDGQAIEVQELRPKGNKLEQLFLNMLNE
jgi:ABC-2 type transport system ATP-binding protein